jgi:tetratricopeptide (TPR) repeat protein
MAFGTARIFAAAMLLAMTLVACGSTEEKASKAATRFDIYYARRDLYSARVEINRVLAAQDDVPEYWARLARLELADGRLLQAYDAYNRVVELDPENSEAIQTMAELSYSGGSYDDAERLADKILEKQPRSLRMQLVKGSVAVERREIDKAKAIAQGMLEIDPINEGATLLLARTVNLGGDRQQAIRIVEQSVVKDGESIPKLLALLDLHSGNADFPATARTFARLFTLMPDNVDLRIEYARLLYEKGRPDRALAMLARLIRRHPGDQELEQRIVDMWTEVGADKVDIDLLGRFVARSGDRPLKMALAHLLLDRQRYADAEQLLRPFVDRETISAPNVEADVLYAGALSGLGRGGEARRMVDRILRFDENNPRALLMRVRVSTRTGDLSQALKDAQVLVRDNPKIAEARVALADIHVRRGEPILADNSYASAMNDLGDDPEMLKAYVGYLRGKGRDRVALDATKRFTRDNPRSSNGWRQRAELCLDLRDGECVDEAMDALEQLPGGQKIRAALLSRRAALGSSQNGRASAAIAAVRTSRSCGRDVATC